MASLISKLIAPQPLTPAMVAELLTEAESAAARLQARYGRVAYKARHGDAEARDEQATLNQDIRAAEDEVRSLTASLVEAKRVEALEQEVARENVFHSQRMSVLAHLGDLKAAAAEYTIAETARAAAWKKLVNHAEKARAACPIGYTWPEAWPNLEELATLVKAETYRVGGEALQSNGAPSPRSLPGYFAHPDTSGMPQSLTPLSETIGQDCDWVSAGLKAIAEGFKNASN